MMDKKLLLSTYISYTGPNSRYQVNKISLVNRTGFYSLFWFILNMVIFYVGASLCARIGDEWIAGIICWILVIRFFGVPISILYRAISSYSKNKSFSIARMSYRQIKKLLKVFPDDLDIGMCVVNFKNKYSDPDVISRLYILYDDEDICGSFFTYLMLAIAWYIHKLTSRIEKFVGWFGGSYKSNKEVKKEFDSKVKKSTEQMLNKMIDKIEDMQSESEAYINKGTDILSDLVNKNNQSFNVRE